MGPAEPGRFPPYHASMLIITIKERGGARQIMRAAAIVNAIAITMVMLAEAWFQVFPKHPLCLLFPLYPQPQLPPLSTILGVNLTVTAVYQGQAMHGVAPWENALDLDILV
mgnify:CR=1 FL=1